MITFETFFKEYPSTPYKSANYIRAKEEFERINPTQDKIKHILSQVRFEQELRDFAADNFRSYSKTPDPHYYLINKCYEAELPTKQEILKFPKMQEEVTLTKDSIMSSDISKDEKSMLRFVLSLSIKIGSSFWKNNKGAIFTEKCINRISTEWKDVLKNYSLDDMKKTIEEVSRYRDTGRYQKPVELPFIQFSLENQKKRRLTPEYKACTKQSFVDANLREIRKQHKDFDARMKLEKTALGKMKVFLEMSGKNNEKDSMLKKCMNIVSVIESKRLNGATIQN